MVSAQTSVRATQTAASHGVVQDYLDVLLRNVLPDQAAQPETDTEPALVAQTWSAERVSESLDTVADLAVVQEASVPEVSKVDASVPEVLIAAREAPDINPGVLTATPETSAAEQIRETAAWADKPFASLLFDVMGLKLAAPLHELGGIMPLADKLQPMAAQADWFMGLIRWNGRTIRVVDTARFVMPERVDAGQEIAYQSVVVLGDSHWALAVNNADQSVHLQPADIRWRQTLGKRPWLAGTVLERLCALLDVDVLVAMLDASDTARQVKADLAEKN